MIKVFYKKFEPIVEKTLNNRAEHKAGERELGVDPKTGKPVFVKIGRFGPMVQIGAAEDEEKPRFAQMPKEQSIETITLEEALELFKLPRNLGNYMGSDIIIGTGRFGPYILHNKAYISLPKEEDPMTISLETAVALIRQRQVQEEQRHLKSFEEEPKLEVLNGRYGPYLAYEGKNYRLPKNLHEKAAELTLEQCMDIIKNTPVKKK